MNYLPINYQKEGDKDFNFQNPFAGDMGMAYLMNSQAYCLCLLILLIFCPPYPFLEEDNAP